MLGRNTVYVLVKKNHLRVRHIESNSEATFDAQPPFTTARLLVGEFAVADALMKKALKQTLKTGFLTIAPQVLVQPLEMIEGGLSEIEERILKELVMGAGASKAVVWVGSQLTDAQVKEKING